MSEGLFTEADWKLFRKKLPEWQENYMGKLIKEYAAILADKGEASDPWRTGICPCCRNPSYCLTRLWQLARL